MKSNSLSDNMEPDKLIAMFLQGTSFPGPQAELLQTDPVYRVIHEMLESRRAVSGQAFFQDTQSILKAV